MGDSGILCVPVTYFVVSIANNFVHSQKIRSISPLENWRGLYTACCRKKVSFSPLVEQWDECVNPNHSRVHTIDEEVFLTGTQGMTTLNKVGSHYLKTAIRCDARRFLEKFVKCLLSTVPSRSHVGQGIFCFCPEIVIGGDVVVPLPIFKKLLDRLLEKGLVKGSEAEACRAEYQSSVWEQRQLEWSLTRSRPDVGGVLSFSWTNFVFCALGNTCIKYVSYPIKQVESSLYVWVAHCLNRVTLQVFQLTALIARRPSTHGVKLVINLDWAANPDWGVRGILLCVQKLVWSSHFTQRSFFLESDPTRLSEPVTTIADSITMSFVYAPWSCVETVCAGQFVTDLRACWDRATLRRRTAKDTREWWYHDGTPRRETWSRSGVRIADCVEDGRAEYVPVVSPAAGPPGPSRIRASPSKWKRKFSLSPVKLPHKLEVVSPPVASQKPSSAEDSSFFIGCNGTGFLCEVSSKWVGSTSRPLFQMGNP